MKYESPVFIVKKFEAEEYIVASTNTTTVTEQQGDEPPMGFF